MKTIINIFFIFAITLIIYKLNWENFVNETISFKNVTTHNIVTIYYIVIQNLSIVYHWGYYNLLDHFICSSHLYSYLSTL